MPTFQDLIKNKSKKCFPSHGIMKSLEVACSVVAHDLKDTLSIHNTWTGVTTLLLSRLAVSQLFCDPTDCSPPGSSDHGISQASILEWAAICSWPRDWTWVSCTGRWALYHCSLKFSQSQLIQLWDPTVIVFITGSGALDIVDYFILSCFWGSLHQIHHWLWSWKIQKE